jgi:protein-tyrosine phosphatase
MAVRRVLFVCLGNICRSPAAEGIMNRLVTQAGLGDIIVCDSAGTSGYHEGDPADARMISHAKTRGYDLLSLSRPFKAPDDFEKFDFILTMDESNFRNILKLDPEGKYRNKVMPMVKFCQVHDVVEVPDPYYQGDTGFHLVLDILEDACSQLLAHIRTELKHE